MSGAKKLDKYWIDENFSYLQPRISLLPLFETSDSFYEDLGSLGETGTNAKRFDTAIAKISSHLLTRLIPVSYGPDTQKNAGELHCSFEPVMTFPGGKSIRPDPNEIKIAGWIRKFPAAKERGMAIGAIISHELSHYCLFNQRIFRDTDDNERLTDLAIIILGLGNLYFNGRDIKKDQEYLQLGYLQFNDMVYAFIKYQETMNITHEKLFMNLSPMARQKISESRKIINADLEDIAREEKGERYEKELGAFKPYLDQLKQKIGHSLSACQNISESISIAIKNQDIINKTHSFWNISDRENVVMGEFTIGLDSATFQIRHEHLTREIKDILQKIKMIEEEVSQKNPGIDDLKKEVQALNEIECSFLQLNEKVLKLSDEISSVIFVQNKIFNQVLFLKNEINTTLEKIQQCRELINEIYFRHNFFCDNTGIWSEYLNDLNLSTNVSNLRETENYENIFTDITRYSTHLIEQFSQPRENFHSLFTNTPTVRDILIELKQRQESLVEFKGRLFSILSSQMRYTSGYIEGSNHLLTYLNNNQELLDLDEKNRKNLKPKQKFLVTYSQHLEISNDDKPILAEITASLNNGSEEIEFSRIRTLLQSTQNTLTSDLDRVQTCSESQQIIPIDAHWKDYHPIAEEHKELHLRITRWADTQNRYITQIRRLNLKSKSTLFEKSRDKIKNSFKYFL